jgi:hypothetical protein
LRIQNFEKAATNSTNFTKEFIFPADESKMDAAQRAGPCAGIGGFVKFVALFFSEISLTILLHPGKFAKIPVIDILGIVEDFLTKNLAFGSTITVITSGTNFNSEATIWQMMAAMDREPNSKLSVEQMCPADFRIP